MDARLETAAMELALLMEADGDVDPDHFAHLFDDEWSEANWFSIRSRAETLVFSVNVDRR